MGEHPRGKGFSNLIFPHRLCFSGGDEDLRRRLYREEELLDNDICR